MAFKLHGILPMGNGNRMLIGGDIVPAKTIVANSEVVQVGDSLEWDTDGFIIASNTVASAIAGILSTVSKNGVAVDPDSATTDTWTVASDNETVAKIYAIMDISPFTLYSVGADVTLGTTPGSDLPGYFMDGLVNDETQLDESSASATTGNFFSWGVDPDDSTRVIVNINEASGHASSV